MRETAYAKINLALHVRERRPDGYHEIETVFAFAEDGDVLRVEGGEGLSLDVEGPFAGALTGESDNLVLRAARALASRFGVARGARLVLDKRLPVASGIGYSPETLAELCKIPTVAAIKDWSNEIVSYEKNLRAVRASGRPVAVMSSFTMSLMASFMLGADGCISGMGSVTADLQSALFAAVQAGRLDEARGINDRVAPLVNVFYAPPFVDMHNRMKEALAILGRIPAAHVRPPLTPVSEDERHRIRLALRAARLSS